MDDLSTSDRPFPLAVAFDIGEVLIDETRVWAIWAELVGVSPLTFSAVLGAAIVQGQDHLEVFPHLAPNIDWMSLEQEHERRYGGFQEKDLYHDARWVLEEVAKDHRVVICGNQPGRRTKQLESLGLRAHAIATSHDVGAEKPDPGFWDSITELCGVPPSRILYVGDRLDNDIEPAIQAGLMTCWLQRGPWGQLQELDEDLEPDLVLEGLGELPEILRAWSTPPKERQG